MLTSPVRYPGPPKYHWAAEVYQYIPETVRAWFTGNEAPRDISAITVAKLSPSMGVYLCCIGGSGQAVTKLYCGSGTLYSSADPAKRGCQKRQNERLLNRRRTNDLANNIKAADSAGLSVTWAQALCVGQIDTSTDTEELLHFRIVAKLGEQLLSTLAGAYVWSGFNLSVWGRIHWKGLCSQCSWPEHITSVIASSKGRTMPGTGPRPWRSNLPQKRTNSF